MGDLLGEKDGSEVWTRTYKLFYGILCRLALILPKQDFKLKKYVCICYGEIEKGPTQIDNKGIGFTGIGRLSMVL